MRIRDAATTRECPQLQDLALRLARALGSIQDLLQDRFASGWFLTSLGCSSELFCWRSCTMSQHHAVAGFNDAKPHPTHCALPARSTVPDIAEDLHARRALNIGLGNRMMSIPKLHIHCPLLAEVLGATLTQILFKDCCFLLLLGRTWRPPA